MIKIITKQLIAAFALFAVAGTASALTLGPIGGGSVQASGSPNVTSLNGSFELKKGSKGPKIKYKAKGSKGAITLYGAPSVVNGSVHGLGSSIELEKAKVDVKKGTLTITARDPFSSSNSKVTLVTATYDGTYDLDLGNDLFGMRITGNAVDPWGNPSLCPLWDFCTVNETFWFQGYAGSFGTDPDKIKVKGSKGPTVAITTIPVPAAVWLFGSGLIGLVGVARRRKRS